MRPDTIRASPYLRIGDAIRRGISDRIPADTNGPAALCLYFPVSRDSRLANYTTTLAIKDRIKNRGSSITHAQSLHIKARALKEGQPIYLTLAESDGTSWCGKVTLSTDWQDAVLPLDQLVVARGLQAPLGYPGEWNYWLTPAKGRGGPGDRPRLEDVEHVQISFHAPAPKSESDVWADFASVALEFK